MGRHNLGDKGGGHRAEERAVIELEGDLAADGRAAAAAVHDEVIAAGVENLDSGWRLEPARIDILTADGEDRLRDVAPIRGGWLLPERSLCGLAPRLGWLDLRLDDFGDESDGVGVQPVDRLTMQSLATDSALQEKVRIYINAAKKRKILTVAERVEDANTMAVLFQLGVTYMQGHYLQEPEVVLEELKPAYDIPVKHAG